MSLPKFTLPRPTSPLPVEEVDKLMSTIEYLQAQVERLQLQIDKLTGQRPPIPIEPLPRGFSNFYFKKGPGDTRTKEHFNPDNARSMGLYQLYIFFLRKDGEVAHSVKSTSLACGVRDGARKALNKTPKSDNDCTIKDFDEAGWKVFHHLLLDIFCEPSVWSEVRGLIRDLTWSLDQKSDPGNRVKYAEHLPYLIKLLQGTDGMPQHIIRHLQDEALSHRGIRGTLADFGDVTFVPLPSDTPLEVKNGVPQRRFRSIFKLDIFKELNMIKAFDLMESGKSCRSTAKELGFSSTIITYRYKQSTAETPWIQLPESDRQAHRERVQCIFNLLKNNCKLQRLREQGFHGNSGRKLQANWKQAITCRVVTPRIPQLPPGPRSFKSKATKRLIRNYRK